MPLLVAKASIWRCSSSSCACLSDGAGTSAALLNWRPSVACEVLPWLTPTRTPGWSTSPAAGDGRGRRHDVAQFDLDQRRGEVHVAGPGLGRIGEGEVHLPGFHGIEHLRHAGELHHLHRHAQAPSQRLAQVQRDARRLAGLRRRAPSRSGCRGRPRPARSRWARARPAPADQARPPCQRKQPAAAPARGRAAGVVHGS